MDWLSRKLVLWQIKKYFHLEDEQQIQVHLLGQHSLTCNNLKLRNSVVNAPTAKLHIQQLTINSLTINYTTAADQPLRLALDGAKLVLAFNPAYQQGKPSYANTKQQLRQFLEAIKSKDALHHRGFVSEEVYQLKKLVGEFFIKKVSLLIKNVDISIQYVSDGEVHALGCELGEVNIKQRVVINHDGYDEDKEMKEEEVICTLEAFSLYLGISSQQDKIEHLAHNRQILRKTKTIRKNYLLQRQQIQIYYNINKNALTLTLPQLSFRFNKLLIVELARTNAYMQLHLSDRPILRPGKGELRQVESGVTRFPMREGTLQWWGFAIKRILERVEQKKQFNILTNYNYRLYLFYLVYRFTIGSNSFVEKCIAEYQQKKLAHSVMTSHALVLSRIDIIRNSGQVQQEMLSFVNFICTSKMVQEICSKNGLKKLTYQKIKSSNVYFNLNNCNQFIRESASSSNMSISVNVEHSLRVEIHESKYDQILLKEGFAMEPTDFYSVKQKYITKFYKKMTEEGAKLDKPFFALVLAKIQFFKNRSETKLVVPSVLLTSEDNNIVMKVQSVVVFKENKTIYASSNKIIVSEKNNYIKVSSVYFNIDKVLVQHFLTIKVMLSEHAIEPLTQQQEFDNYLEENIYKRLPKHPFFESFSDQSTSIQIKKTLIVTSLFEENQYITVELNGIDYSSPSNNKPPKISLEKLSVSRSRLSNFDKLLSGRLEKLSVHAESVMVENNKPLALTSNKYLRKHNGYIYYESVLDIIIPFILIQISFQDIYFFQLAANYWSELFSNEYLFPRRKAKTQTDMKVIQMKQTKIDYFEMLNTFTKSSRTRVKLQGIELVLYGQNNRLSHNEFLTMLIEGILYENKVYILGMDTNITIFNIFVENCLGTKTFNQFKLLEIIEKRPKTEQPLIYGNKYEPEGSCLLLYGLNQSNERILGRESMGRDILGKDSMGERVEKNKAQRSDRQQTHMIKLKMKNQFSMKNFRKSINTYIVIKPLFIFHSPDYYQILTNSLKVIGNTAANNFKRTFPPPKPTINDSEHEILEAKNISQKTIFVCEIQKVNLIALHQNEPIYTFSLLDITVKHETQAYVTKYEVLISELYVVDISLNCGLHPIVIKAVPVEIFFTKYQSDLLKKKEKKSALLRISLYNSEIFYLNRKIKELTNFIMSHFQDSPQEEPASKQKLEEAPKAYPFCYRVEFIKPVIMLLRSSLSEEKMISEAQNLLIANYLEAGEEMQPNKDFFFDASRERFNNDSFESCMEIKEQEIQFHSFAKAEEEESEIPNSQLHINLLNFYVYSSLDDNSDTLIFTPQIVITLAGKHLRASIKTMNINFTSEDYRLLIRITEENFSETPVSYPKDSIETEYKNLGFQSSYSIEEVTMSLREKAESQKFGELLLTNIIGDNIMYTNGEKEDIIRVESLEYQSCINNSLEKIISKKEKSNILLHEISRPQNCDQLGNKTIERATLFKEFAQKFSEQNINDEAQKKFFEESSAYQFDGRRKDEDHQSAIRGGAKGHTKEETNLNRLGKWIKGMCKKCMCCCKNEAHEQEYQKQTEERLKRNGESISPNQEQQRSIFHEDMMNLQESFIQDPKEIINFSAKVNPDDYKAQLKSAFSVYMHIKGEKSRQKRMYMLAQHLNIYYEKNMHIMALINFLNKPYAQPEKPEYVREAKFNNYRPFQMLIEVADTSIFAVQKQALNQRSLQLDVHCFYNLEKLGDPNNGPGKKLLETDLKFQMFYQDAKTLKRTTLSDPIRLIHSKQANVSYHNRSPVKNFQKLLMLSAKPSSSRQHSHQKSKTVKLNFPIYIIKSLVELVKSLQSKPKSNPAPKPVDMQNQSNVPVITNKTSLEQQIEIKRTQKTMAFEAENKQKTLEKKANELKVVNSVTFKKFYIPNIEVDIQTKQNVSFITLFLQHTHLKNRQMAKQLCDTKDQTIDVDVSISYWNLNLGKFEPFLENCKFIVQQQSLKRDNTENNKLKLITKSQKDVNAPDYRNGLCINLTTAFFHTYKQLELKYLLQNQRLEISNQICYDLTKKDPEVYEFMKMKKQYKQEQLIHGDSIHKNFPEDLKNFFGRRFKVEDLTQLTKKKGKRSQVAKNKFHVEGLKVFLYHSYLQPSSKLKFITYRTPFRLYNITQYKIQAKFTQTNRSSRHQKWCYDIGSKEYYSIPEDIYQFDFLANLSVGKRKHYEGNFEDQQADTSIQKISHFAQGQEIENTMPVKYLVQMNANKNEYNEMGKHKLNEYIFNLSSLQKRWIDKRDTVISSNNISLCLINVKSQCEEIKDKVFDGSKIIPYDSLTIIISPIIIYNYTSQSFNISNCKKKKYEIRPSKSVQLNEFPPGVLLSDVVIEFQEDPAHHEYDFLRRQVGIKNETMLIDRNQSVNIRTIKETYNTCLIEIYPDWLIVNQTEFQFHLLYDRKEFVINQRSMNSLAIDNQTSKGILNMKIKLIDDHDDGEQFHRFGTETGLVDIFTLSKVDAGDVKNIKQEVTQKGCCGKIKDKELLSDPTKSGDQRAFKCIQFVVNIEQSMNYTLTKNLYINYKYWIVNQMDVEMIIYQYSLDETIKIEDGQEKGIEIIRLKPKEQNYLYTYDFLSKQFYLKIKHQDEYIYSNNFPCNQSMGRSLSLKLKKNLNNDAGFVNLAYHETYHHIRIDMEQVKYTNILTFTYIEEVRTKHPFYINNATNYFVKIKQNGESFKIRPKTRVPFSWSNLVDNKHQIQVEIEGQSMTYSLKERTEEFEPIVIKGDNIASKSSKNISSKALFKRERCLVKWKGLNAESQLIFDIFAKKLHVTSEQPFWLSMNQAQRLVSTSNKIEIFFKNREIFEFYPSMQSLKDWADLLRNFLNSNVIDKIYFTIESLQNSMIYFIHNLEINNDNDIKIDHREYVIQNFYLSVINSNPLHIEEIVLINMENIEYIEEDRLSEMREQKQSYLIKKAEQTIKIKKFKINNQLRNALNPVILSQIKKSNYPFLQIKREKQNLVLSEQQVRSSDSIEHYKSSTFFLDEAELIIEAALIPELLNFKKNIDQISSQYSYDKDSEQGKASAVKPEKRAVNNQIYIDYLEIKPIKMTISVSFDANIDKQFEPKLMNFLTMIPAGVQNAIITIDSFMFHHVFMEDSRLKQTLRQYYIYEMKKQILFNAGSIQILTPFKLIKGLGIGFTSIFYNPFYELVNTKEIKSFTSNFLEGFITLIVFIFSMGFSLLNSIFKFLAVLTKDNNFQTRRQKFRNQIFKSPIDGFSYGARYWTRVFKQFFINFITWPCEYNSKAPCIGLLFGFILSILYIIIWIIKLLVTTYDFFYVIGLGLLSWGFYEENSMKYRTRPIRTFPHKRLLPYDYLTAKGNEIMRRNLIQENDNQEISFISHIQAGDESKYLLLSNYRILYCSHELTSFKEITLYKISKVVIGPLKKNTRNGEIENLYVEVHLTFPDQYKCLCIDCSNSSYELKFKDLRCMKEFLDKLQANLDKERIDFNLENENLKLYERSIENESIQKHQHQKMIKNESSNLHEIPLSQSKARS